MNGGVHSGLAFADGVRVVGWGMKNGLGGWGMSFADKTFLGDLVPGRNLESKSSILH